MRIMVLGSGGFIGRYIVAELLAHEHEVIAVARHTEGLAEAFPEADFIALNLAMTAGSVDWSKHLQGTDAIINAAGVLRGREMAAVHVHMPEALYHAAGQAGVSRVVLISAISARADVPSDYSQSKLTGEKALRASGLDWVIMRPSLVYGDGSYGGMSLMRGMAALPWFVPVPGGGGFAFTPIHVRDLARAVRLGCEDKRHVGQVLEPVGPVTLNLKDILGRYRCWLGLGVARYLSIPMPVMSVLARLGDVVGKGPIATNSLVQMIAGNAGDSATFAKAIGFVPRSLDAALRDRPAQVQDRWHARLFFVAPVLKAMLVLLWLVSATLGFFNGAEQTVEVVQGLGLPLSWAEPLRMGGSLLDLGLAALLFADRAARWSTLAQLVVVIGYTVVISIALPALWLDPLGPLLKNLPILLAIAIHGCIGDQR